MSVVSIKQAIVNKLNTISSIRNVYTYNVGSPQGYPYAVVTHESTEGEYADFSAISKRYKRKYSFRVKIYQEIENYGMEDAESLIDNIIDEVFGAFDSDLTLGGTVINTEVIGSSTEYEATNGVHVVASFSINCIKLVQAN